MIRTKKTRMKEKGESQTCETFRFRVDAAQPSIEFRTILEGEIEETSSCRVDNGDLVFLSVDPFESDFVEGKEALFLPLDDLKRTRRGDHKHFLPSVPLVVFDVQPSSFLHTSVVFFFLS